MAHPATTLYVRVKRQKQTIFLYTEPHQTIKVLKNHIAHIEGSNPDDIQLRFPADVVLEDDKTVADYKIDERTGQIVYLLHKAESGDWEPIDIHDPEPKGVSREEIEKIRAQHQPKTT